MKRQGRLAACAAVVVWLAGPGTYGARQTRKASTHRAVRSKGPEFNQRPFTANITITGKSDIYHGKIYAEADAMRTDVRLSSGADASIIERFDKGVEWILTPGKHYVVAPISEREDLIGALRDASARVKKQDLGSERVGEYSCEEYRVEVFVRRHKISGWIWVARAPAMDEFIVKAKDGASGESVELSNIRFQSPDSALFDLPAGYRQLTKPSKHPNRAP